jgi:hypothetical protein
MQIVSDGCMSASDALFCHPGMSALRSILGVKRKLRRLRQMVENDPKQTFAQLDIVAESLGSTDLSGSCGGGG